MIWDQGRVSGRPVVVAVTGYRGCGKTTAIEGLVAVLRNRGYRVGTLKHCHHGFNPDTPGKDSWRHRRAGSEKTLLVNPDGFALYGDPVPGGAAEHASRFLADLHLVFAEGFHWEELPRVEILGLDGESRPAHPGGECLARLPHRFTQGQVREVADCVEAGLLTQPLEVL